MNIVQRVFLAVLSIVFLVTPAISMAQVTEELEAQLLHEVEALEALEDKLAELQILMDGEGIPKVDVETIEAKAKVTGIISDEVIDGYRQMIFTVDVDGKELTVDTAGSYLEGLRYDIKVGDRVYLQIIEVNGEVDQIFLADIVRTGSLAWLIILFAVVIIAVGRWRGVASLVGLAITLLILFVFILPMILAGHDAVLVTVIGSIVILATNMHLSHGFNKGTFLAFGSTTIGLMLVVVFATIFVWFADLSGLASEEAVLLYFQAGDFIIPKGILLSAIILGAVGVLDDIAITQGETIAELIDANPKLDRKDLFFRAMRIGRHHIASTVNTLVLAYVGVALPLLLLFMANPEIGTMRFLNEELVAEEIVRTLAGTMALVLTVPISTWLATFVKKR